ncbi:Lipoprotein-releasing system transmembrane protein LolE [Vibrio hippocampi]|uniref:Lipoprotein-releasing system transmembrane protein LolE n=1 Tax=Vibrio hippocampi TaxID=654686 RepID=A0ABN8DEL5_9VIBR|nr:Lipoprotein-releasing system transmembrane protein LolE [Vibrio hippocampi]
MSLSFFIGQRFSRAKQRNKMVSFISISSIVGIAVGVAVIVVGLSAMNGFERELNQRVLSVIAHGEFEGVNEPIYNWQRIADTSLSNSNVVAAAPYVRMTALVERGKDLKAVEIKGVEPSLEQKVSSLAQFVDKEAWQSFKAGENRVILGRGVANELNVEVGDSVTLMIPTTTDATKIQAPRRVRVKVHGLLTLNGQIDHNLALVPLEDAQQYARLGDKVTGVSIKMDDVFAARYTVRQIGMQLTDYVYLRSWEQKYGFLHRDIQLVRTIMYLVMFLVIGVACFNIVSTLMMAVKDRAGDIAILRTMGASDGLVKRIFIWQGLFSGVVGSVIGGGLGCLLALNLTPMIASLERLIGHKFLSGDIYFVDFLPSELRVEDVVTVALTAMVLSLIATWYPAKKASQLNPASVLSAK